jgi:coronin-1B/1C/6
MPPKIVRDSKFRHVFSEECTKESYLDLKPANKPTENPGIRANEKYIAVGWDSGGGSTVCVIPSGNIGRMKGDIPLIAGHKSAVLDFEWNPFNDSLLITAAEDNGVKLWQIPEGGLKEHMKEPLVSLEGHQKKVAFSTWNRNAANILATNAYDMTVRVWDVIEQEQISMVEMPDQVWSMKWNYTGSLIAITAKDKKMRILDPRQKAFAAETEGMVHAGSKGTKIEWMGRPGDSEERNRIITTGFTKEAERQIKLWDMRTLAQEVTTTSLDQGTGALYPTYDAGTNLLFLAGKGDSMIKYFEMDKEEPYIHFITSSSGKVGMRGCDFLPKRDVDTTKHEIMRAVKLETASIVPISFRVPRKSEEFQEDIFPDCPSQDPAMTAEQWKSGAEGKEPKLQSMVPGANSKRKSSAAPAIVSLKDVKAELAKAKDRIAELEAENASLKEQLAAKS